jgi:hypothetical protein
MSQSRVQYRNTEGANCADVTQSGGSEMIHRSWRFRFGNSALRQWAPSAALVGATAIWGSTFVVTKDATEQMSVLGFLTWRFGIATALLLVFCWRDVRAMSPVVLRRSIVIGVFLWLHRADLRPASDHSHGLELCHRTDGRAHAGRRQSAIR